MKTCHLCSRFQLPDMNNPEKMFNRIVNNLIYYQVSHENILRKCSTGLSTISFTIRSVMKTFLENFLQNCQQSHLLSGQSSIILRKCSTGLSTISSTIRLAMNNPEKMFNRIVNNLIYNQVSHE